MKQNKAFFLLGLLIIVIVGFLSFYKLKIIPLSGGKTEPTPAVSAKKGTITLKAGGGEVISSDQTAIPIFVLADSSNEPINQFEIVISYDKNATQLENYKPLLADFDYAVQKGDGNIKITGIKKLSADQPSVFKETQVAQLTFEKAGSATESGNATFSFSVLTSTSSESKLVDAKNLSMAVTGSSINLFSGTKITLAKNQATILPGTGITLKLLTVSIPESNCRDCITSAKVNATKDEQEQQLEFKIGGFAGFMQNRRDAFDYTFQLDKINPGSVDLVYLPKP